MRYQYVQGMRQLVPAGTAQTDDRGEYRVWGLNPGEYYVSAIARNRPTPRPVAGSRRRRDRPGQALRRRGGVARSRPPTGRGRSRTGSLRADVLPRRALR